MVGLHRALRYCGYTAVLHLAKWAKRRVCLQESFLNWTVRGLFIPIQNESREKRREGSDIYKWLHFQIISRKTLSHNPYCICIIKYFSVTVSIKIHLEKYQTAPTSHFSNWIFIICNTNYIFCLCFSKSFLTLEKTLPSVCKYLMKKFT